jgi:hypothetical protein
MNDPTEADLVAEHVDRHPTGPSEGDEEAVLRGLYGSADDDGVYRGELA